LKQPFLKLVRLEPFVKNFQKLGFLEKRLPFKEGILGILFPPYLRLSKGPNKGSLFSLNKGLNFSRVRKKTRESLFNSPSPLKEGFIPLF